MSRIDWVILRRFASRVLLVLVLMYGLFVLIDSLNTPRFAALSSIGGPLLGVFGIALSAVRWLIGTLPITILLGTMLTVNDLDSRRELTIIKSTGLSIWSVMRGPLLATLIVGIAVSTVGNWAATAVNRGLPYSSSPRDSNLYLEQKSADGTYVLHADLVGKGGSVLSGVMIFFTGSDDRDRIVAEQATLSGDAWVLDNVVRYAPGRPPERLQQLAIPTQTTAVDMQLMTAVGRDPTLPELLAAIAGRIVDPTLRAAALTNLLQVVALPMLMCGSVLMGFAFTAGYRRTNRLGGAVLYGVVLGFVVYVVTSLAIRSGSAGVLDPAFAAIGPAGVAIVIGLTVLLFKEDGRA